MVLGGANSRQGTAGGYMRDLTTTGSGDCKCYRSRSAYVVARRAQDSCSALATRPGEATRGTIVPSPGQFFILDPLSYASLHFSLEEAPPQGRVLNCRDIQVCFQDG